MRFAGMLSLIMLLFSSTYSQPASPILPKDQTVISDTVVDLIWNPAKGSNISYQVQVSTDTLFSSTLYDQSGLLNNSKTITLSIGYTYFWRVRHFISGVPQSWSKTNSFITFSPEIIPGLEVWLESNSGIILQNGKVINWNSKTGNYILSQTDTAKQPTIKDSALYENRAVYFDGIDDLLQGTFINAPEITIVALHRPLKRNTSLISQARFTFSGFNWYINNANRPSFTCIQTPANTGYSFSGHQYQYPVPSNINNIDGLILTDTSQTVFTYKQDSVSHQTISFLDNPANTNLRLGAMGNNSAFYNGYVFDILIFENALKKNEYELVHDYLINKYYLPVDLGADIDISSRLCPPELKPSRSYLSYNWSTGDTTKSIFPAIAGTYWLEATDLFGRVTADTIVVTGEIPQLNLYDTTICMYDTLIINPGISTDFSFQWNNDSTLNQPFFQAVNEGYYSLKIIDSNNCYIEDSLYLSIDDYALSVSLGADKSLCAGETIQLVSGAYETVKWKWSTGIHDTMPSIAIHTSANYSVTTTNANGCKAFSSINVQIKGVNPYVDFNMLPQQICYKDTLLLIDQSIAIYPNDNLASWLWTMGDGTIYSKSDSIKHLYSLPGTYPITLEVTTDSGCYSTFTDTAVIHPLPDVGISPNKTCSKTPVQFHYTPQITPTAYSWIFRNNTGNPYFSNDASPVYTWQDHGNFYVVLSVTSNLGCVNTDSIIVDVTESPTAMFTYNPTMICHNDTVQFFNNSTANPSYPNNFLVWDFGDGSQKVYNKENPKHIYSQPGQYDVIVVVGSTASGCKDTIKHNIIVNNKPEAMMMISDFCINENINLADASTVLSDSIISWIWNIENLGTFTGENPVVSFQDTGKHKITLIVETDKGCVDSASDITTVFPSPQAYFTMSQSFGEPPLNVNFFNLTKGAVSYNWDFDDGSFSSQESPSHLFTDNKIFNVDLIASSDKGCQAQYSRKVYTLPAEIDIEIIRIETVVSNGSVQPIVEFRNNSSIDIHKVDFMAWVNKGSPVMETWTAIDIDDILLPGQTKRYNFTSRLLTGSNPDKTNDIICVKAVIPEFHNEINPDNNQKCKAVTKKFVVADPFPNPAKSSFNIDIIIDIPDNIIIDLQNIHGQKIYTIFEGYLNEGLNRINVPVLNSLKPGVHLLNFTYRDIVINKKIIILK